MHLNKVILGICALCLILAGCSRLTTIKPQLGSRLQITVTFAAPILTTQNIYIVLNKLVDPALPGLQPDFPFMFYPGQVVNYALSNLVAVQAYRTSSDSVVNYYYSTYFSTWATVIKINPATVMAYAYVPLGVAFPVSANVASHEQIVAKSGFTSSLVMNGSVMVLSFDLSQLQNPPNLGEAVYLDIISMRDQNDLADHFDVDNQYILNELGQVVQQNDRLNDSPIGFPSLDIVSWKLEIL